MSFLFGGKPQLSSAEKIAAAETEVEMISDMFNRYVYEARPCSAEQSSPYPKIKSIVYEEVHTCRLPRRRSQQGRVGLSGSMRGKVLRGQCQGQREDARRGGWEASRRWRHVWHVRKERREGAIWNSRGQRSERRRLPLPTISGWTSAYGWLGGLLYARPSRFEAQDEAYSKPQSPMAWIKRH
jgi:hypothetical protein